VVAGGAAGYPFGLRYSRRVPYRVTAGDVGALVTTELLGVAAASTILADTDPSDEAVFGVLTAGYALGLVVGDRLLVRRFDHTDAEARLLLLGTVAGGVMGAAIPALAETDSDRGILAAQTIGAILGALVAENMIEPRREGAQSRAGLRSVPARFGIRFSPEGILALGMRRSGHHSILSVAF
jgi:hypothetical protein